MSIVLTYKHIPDEDCPECNGKGYTDMFAEATSCKECNKGLKTAIDLSIKLDSIPYVDVNLIAAAPELLEACKLALNDLRFLFREGSVDSMNALEEAIKKAEGQDE